jgi:large subunit ribosomal protein L33
LCPQAKCLKVKLFSEANTGYFYTWKKNPKAYPWRIALRKYDPIVRKHVLFKVRHTPKLPARRAACHAQHCWTRLTARTGAQRGFHDVVRLVRAALPRVCGATISICVINERAAVLLHLALHSTTSIAALRCKQIFTRSMNVPAWYALRNRTRCPAVGLPSAQSRQLILLASPVSRGSTAVCTAPLSVAGVPHALYLQHDCLHHGSKPPR